MASNPWCRLLVLVCALQTFPRGSLALGKVSPHCSKGLCLYLIPGDRVGLLKAQESLANPVVPGADQDTAAVPPKAGRKLLLSKKKSPRQAPKRQKDQQKQKGVQKEDDAAGAGTQNTAIPNQEQLRQMKHQFVGKNPMFSNPNGASTIQVGQTQVAADPAAQAQVPGNVGMVNMAGTVPDVTTDQPMTATKTVGVGGDPNAIAPKGQFLRVYFPTLPRSGQLHLRKLWEACTKRVTESVHEGFGLQLNPRTGAFAPPCGGIALSAENETAPPPADDADRCGEIRLGRSTDPVLLKLNKPSEGSLFQELFQELVEGSWAADVILMLVRNPVDAYQSTFRARNPRYALTEDASDLEWTLTLDQYLETMWEPYVTLFNDVPVPRVVMRYEDLHRDPQDFMKEALVYTGVASAQQLDDQLISAAVTQVQKATRKLAPKDVVGEGFKVLMRQSQADQQLAMTVLSKYSATLKSLGYVYYKEAEGVPADLAAMIAVQEQAERSRLFALMDAGFNIKEAGFSIKAAGFNIAEALRPDGDTMIMLMVVVVVVVVVVVDKLKARAAGTSSTLGKAVAFTFAVADAARNKKVTAVALMAQSAEAERENRIKQHTAAQEEYCIKKHRLQARLAMLRDKY